MANVFSYAFTTAKANQDEDQDDDASGGGPYAAQQVGGAAAFGGDDDSNLFSEITAAGMQTGMGTIAGFGYGRVTISSDSSR